MTCRLPYSHIRHGKFITVDTTGFLKFSLPVLSSLYSTSLKPKSTLVFDVFVLQVMCFKTMRLLPPFHPFALRITILSVSHIYPLLQSPYYIKEGFECKTSTLFCHYGGDKSGLGYEPASTCIKHSNSIYGRKTVRKIYSPIKEEVGE